MMKKGFTLIELLVVVLIVGILAAVAVPQYNKASTKSALATLKVVTENISKSARLYYMEYGKYPTSLRELDAPEPISSNNSGTTYTYAWGNCVLLSGGFERINCSYGKAHISYIRYHRVKDSSRVCVGSSPTAIAICKQETGRTTPTYSNNGVEEFLYRD